jgi:hypothetical protein
MAAPFIDLALLSRFGLEGAVKTIEVNPALFPAVRRTLEASGLLERGADKAVGNLLFSLTSALPDSRAARRDFIARYIGDGKITNNAQMAAAVDFFKKRAPDATFEVTEFETACGSGVSFTDAELTAKVDEIIAAARSDIVEQRYLFQPALLLTKLDGPWRWAEKASSEERGPAECYFVFAWVVSKTPTMQ